MEELVPIGFGLVLGAALQSGSTLIGRRLWPVAGKGLAGRA